MFFKWLNEKKNNQNESSVQLFSSTFCTLTLYAFDELIHGGGGRGMQVKNKTADMTRQDENIYLKK